MERKLVNAIQVFNILFQAIYSLLFPVGVGAVISYVLVEFCGAKSWVWALLLTAGVLVGLVSMVKFVVLFDFQCHRVEMRIGCSVPQFQVASRDGGRKGLFASRAWLRVRPGVRTVGNCACEGCANRDLGLDIDRGRRL